MVEGWNRQRSYNLEGARLIAYTVAAANRDPKKPFPQIEDFLPLPTDELKTKEEKEAELMQTRQKVLDRIKKAFPNRFTA